MIKSIKLKTGIASPEWSYSPGDVVEVGDKIDREEAARWIKAGIAELESSETPKQNEENTENVKKTDENERKKSKTAQKSVKNDKNKVKSERNESPVRIKKE